MTERQSPVIVSDEQFFQHVAENLPIMLVTYDVQERRYSFINRAVRQFVAFLPGGNEAPLLAMQTLVHPEDISRFGRLLNMLVGLSDGVPVSETVRVRGEDGQWHILKMDLWVDGRTPDGQPHRVVTTALDLTPYLLTRQTEVDATVEIARVRLMEDIVRDMAHDLRTPISNLKVYSYLLQQLTDKMSKQVIELNITAAGPQLAALNQTAIDIQRRGETLRQTTEHLHKLSDTLFDLALLDSRMRYSFRSGDINRVVRDVCQANQVQAAEAEVMLVFIPGDLEPMMVDDYELSRALNQIVDNAVQNTPPGGRIALSTCRIAQECLIEITDSGVGMTVNELSQIFVRFYRADRARNARNGNLGLGLNIAQKIVQAHKGRIEAESKLGEGSTFRVYLPIQS